MEPGRRSNRQEDGVAATTWCSACKGLSSGGMRDSHLDAIPLPMAHVDGVGRWIWANRALLDVLRMCPDELESTRIQDVVLTPSVSSSDGLKHGSVVELDHKRVKMPTGVRDGMDVTIRLAAPCEQPGGHYTIYLDSDGALAEASFDAMLEGSPDPVVIVGGHAILFANRAAAVLFGEDHSSGMVGLEAASLVDPDHVHELANLISKTRESGAMTDVKPGSLIRVDGQPVSVDLEMIAVPVNYRGSPAMEVLFHNVSERRQVEEQLRWQAHHDSLTGLLNRQSFRRQLDLALESNHSNVALLLLDLDRFKDVNDTFGHHFGDLLLSELGPRLGSLFDGRGSVARLGGDEFAVVLPAAGETYVRDAATMILSALDEPFIQDGHLLDVGGSIGAALYPLHGTSSIELLRKADVAMYSAKHDRKGFAFYDHRRDHHTPERLKLMTELRSAMDREELSLFYQPKADLRERRVVSAEALVRWNHPVRGLIKPDEFIPAAESGGLINRLTLWVLDTALHQVRIWRESGREISVAINLSPRNLHDPDLVELVEQALISHRVDPDGLSLELTETAIMDDPDGAMWNLRQLHDMGVRIAIDDFGTGYSSLGYLRRLPVDEIKIDRSFVTDMVRQSEDAFIVRSTIELGHNLGLNVVAEGVEDERTWDLLGVLGCDLIQGYFISPPVPVGDMTAMLNVKRHSRNSRRRAA